MQDSPVASQSSWEIQMGQECSRYSITPYVLIHLTALGVMTGPVQRFWDWSFPV